MVDAFDAENIDRLPDICRWPFLTSVGEQM